MAAKLLSRGQLTKQRKKAETDRKISTLLHSYKQKLARTTNKEIAEKLVRNLSRRTKKKFYLKTEKTSGGGYSYSTYSK